jgi:hypothetical protein
MNNNVQIKPLYPETAKFMEWYNSEKERGLLDVKFFAQGAEGTSAESFFGEVNRAIAAEGTSDSEFF